MKPSSADPDPQYRNFWVRDPAFYRNLLLLALPIILQNLITFGVVFADNVMVGSLGETAISGLYLGTLVHTVLQFVLAGVESALLILSTQYWGERNIGRIKDVISIAMRISLAGTLAVSLVSFCCPGIIMNLLTDDPGAAAEGAKYLRAVCASYPLFCVSQLLITAMRSVEIARVGLFNSIAAFSVNVLLNYVFIFGNFGMPALGVTGAALATDCSRVAELGVVLWFVFASDRTLRLRLLDFRRWNRDILRDLARYGSPLLLGQIVWAANIAGQSAIIGHLSGPAIASASIAGMFDRLLWMGTWGLAAATGIVIGKAIGAGRFAAVRQYAKTMQAVFFGIGIVCAGVIWFGYPYFLDLYKLGEETRAVAEQFMRVLAVITVGRCYQAPSLFGLVKAGGDTAFVFKNDTVWVFCWVLPVSALALHLGAPAWLVFALLLSDQIGKCFVALVKINRFDWMKKLTRDRTSREARTTHA